MNEEERFDLSALNPDVDDEAWSALLDRTTRDAVAAIEQRRDSTVVAIAGWRRPLLAAATFAALLLSSLLLRARTAEAGAAALAESSPAWLIAPEPPDPALILRALDSEPLR